MRVGTALRLSALCLAAPAALSCWGRPREGPSAGKAGPGDATILRIEASRESRLPSNAFFNEANIAAFQAAYPGIRVEITLHPDAQTLNAFRAALSGGTPPDLIVYSKVAAENELDATSTMQDLSAEPFARRLVSSDRLRSPGGGMYLFQRAVDEGGIGIVYNRAIFRRLGLEVPRTYPEFLTACEAIKAAGLIPIYGPFKDTWTFQIWTTASWGNFAELARPGLWRDIHAGSVHWNEVPEFLAALERGQALQGRGYFQPTCLQDEYAGAPAALRSGRYAMLFMTHSILVEMAQSDPGLQLGMFPVPAFDDPSLNAISQGQPGGAFVPKAARNRKEALLFLDFLSRPEQIARDLADPVMAYAPNFVDAPPGYRRPPALEDLYRDFIRPGRVATEMNAYLRVGPTDLWTYYQDMLAGLKSPREVLDSWDRRFRSLMRQKGAAGF